uniref:hypothetical protein n=1 Tax=Ndongobacter massiliensis TaxID=1871025 RepID=UPI000931BF34|nr:hypothetical protein [Ndongobacter massiliensis]
MSVIATLKQKYQFIELHEDRFLCGKTQFSFFKQKPPIIEADLPFDKVECVEYYPLGMIRVVEKSENGSPQKKHAINLMYDEYITANGDNFIKWISENTSIPIKNISGKTYEEAVNERMRHEEEARIEQERLKEQEANAPVRCPKCGSTQVFANKKGLSVGRAIVGGALTGGVGAVLGGLSSKKIIVTCMKCGHQWKVGK